MIFPLETIQIGNCIGFLSRRGSRWGKDFSWHHKRLSVIHEGDSWQSYRLSYHLNVEEIPRLIGAKAKEGQICHTCDNRWCIEPTHLYKGSKSSNGKDCYERHPTRRMNGIKCAQNPTINTRTKISVALTGKPKSEAHRKNLSDAAKRRRYSEEQKSKMSETMKRVWREKLEVLNPFGRRQ